MNIIQTKIWIVFFICLSPFTKGSSQTYSTPSNHRSLEFYLTAPEALLKGYQPEVSRKDTVPVPKSVFLKSLMIPGWGQWINQQAWKIPIVYGVILGTGYYSYYSHTLYSDYRAAYYNSQANEVDGTYLDQRFGPTPPRLEGVSSSSLRSSRDLYRNRRDLFVVVTALMWTMNAVDAYIFAHLRDYDISDNLSFHSEPHPRRGNHFHITLTLPL